MNYTFEKIFILVSLPILFLASTSTCIAKEQTRGSLFLKTQELRFSNNTSLQAYLAKKIVLQFQEKAFEFSPKDFFNKETNFSFDASYSSEIEKSSLCLDQADGVSNINNSPLREYSSICNLINTTSSVGHLKKGALLKIDAPRINSFVSTLSEEIVSAPKNAKLKIVTTENKDGDDRTLQRKIEIISPAKSGFSLDEEKTVSIILTALSQSEEKIILHLPTKEDEAKISQKTLERLNVKEQIGHGESNFRGSPRNRIHNINVAVDRFNGLLLEPGQEFSFVEILGPVEKETGYKEELVIKDNKTIPEYGGGICQVSTTVFRAALNTGFKITERRNHAYPVQYYSPQGTDATIYLPKPDLRFINNTPGYIIFQTSIVGSKLIFDVFGESDGREVKMEGPRVTARTPDGGLKVTLKQVVRDQNGELVFEDTFKSVYDNPDKYHETEVLKIKPDNWSNKQWKVYKKEHNL
ncbi:hypothetical protein HOB25_03490 [bacterium]|jgi:vancomycin resistance protein YoaR|nr:hypothetical protein [bacterium]MBT6754025.1 hypothetical protein [bacterium]MBT7992703.1 hypothetical protein [bacterium]